jgi:very-short-patch-repair endonuclease/superfamily II DNA or RNA helicase
MTRLEDLTRGASLRGILPDSMVTVVAVQWYGSDALELTYKDAGGRPGTRLLYRDDEPTLAIVSAGRPWSFDGDGRLFRLVAEAHRIRLAHLFDPVLAVHTSLVEPLPHQITAVYETMLSRQPLRFLLADDPGAGKTIMAGLLIKELIARGDLQRCLIVCPGSLAEQWQDELYRRFHLPFEILTNDKLEAARTGNWFLENHLVIARLDKLARDESVQQKLQAADGRWDLVVCDEAHKLSATFFGGELKYTRRYRLGQLLGTLTRHFLLMTATPHNGKEEDFQLFLALLDGDRFEGRFRDGVHQVDVSDLMRRMVKERLLKFDGTPLFPERIAYTVPYKLSDAEAQLYREVTNYVREEFNRAEALQNDKRAGTVGFALTVLQRRLASSPEAIYQSLHRRRERLEKRLRELELLQRGATLAPSPALPRSAPSPALPRSAPSPALPLRGREPDSSPQRGEVGWGAVWHPTPVPPVLLAAARALRASMTDAEQLLWQSLRGKQLEGFRFRKQHPIERYVLDFYCPSARLAIEVDGNQHATPEGQGSDAERTAWLEGQGIRVLRFSNREVLTNLEGVLTVIWEALQHSSAPALPRSATSPALPRSATSPALPRWGREPDSSPQRGEAGWGAIDLSADDLDDLEDAPDHEVAQVEEEILDQATAARTIDELKLEIANLARLESLALTVRQSGEDRKWRELASLLGEIFTPAAIANRLAEEREPYQVREITRPMPSPRQKLVVFTEHRDTLNYLVQRISTLLGRVEAVVTIHGGMGREERLKAQEAFRHDPEVQVLIATDAAGEGINLQRAHLMVNYDLPWNPNRLEQRFGRIHRIGQTEVCHLWNLVAEETREGDVYRVLLDKLEQARQALGGQVFDVLGKLQFEGKPLRELLIDAVRYGERPDVRARLTQAIENAVDRRQIQDLLEERALAHDAMDARQVARVREDMERAEARRLQPHYIESFFLEAFTQLGGTLRQREPRRYEVTHVPAPVRNRDRMIGIGDPVLPRYERIAFEKALLTPPGQPLAAFVCPGHPLLDATLDLLLERHRDLLRRGTLLVDERDHGTQPRVLFSLEHAIQDASPLPSGERRTISRQMLYVELAADGTTRSLRYAPYLDYRPLEDGELETRSEERGARSRLTLCGPPR